VLPHLVRNVRGRGGFLRTKNFPAAANLGILVADNSKATWPGLHVVF
jgi:hypothetical protein